MYLWMQWWSVVQELRPACSRFRTFLWMSACLAAMTVRGDLMGVTSLLVSRVKKNAVAYEQPPEIEGRRPRGRPRKYGEKIKLRSMFNDPRSMQEVPSPVYGETNVTLRFYYRDLLWRPVGILIRFVAVIHPTRGMILLMSTDTNLAPVEIIRIYSLRFKIELSFKQALRVIGTYGYHFWMAAMTPIGRASGNQHLHKKSQAYRDAVRRKIGAYHCHIQIGIIAQGLLQYLSSAFPQRVWSAFGSWIRTIRPGLCPSEPVTAMAMRNALPAFLADSPENTAFTKFLRERIDQQRAEGLRMLDLAA